MSQAMAAAVMSSAAAGVCSAAVSMSRIASAAGSSRMYSGCA
ncbi:hypothetical protein [Streptomyces sp. URMC 125]